jgi:hypothetical protein
MNIISQPPQFLTNYARGWVGFISRHDNFIADGIDWFSRWDELDHVPISHTFNIVGQDTTVEALEPEVSYGSLHDYLDDPEIALLVRKPRTRFFERICNQAILRLGDKYNNRLIAALALNETFLGRALNKFSLGAFESWLVRRALRPHTWDCSMLVTETLRQPDLIPLGGVLTWTPGTVKPIDLFEDQNLFEPGAIELVPSSRQS